MIWFCLLVYVCFQAQSRRSSVSPPRSPSPVSPPSPTPFHSLSSPYRSVAVPRTKSYGRRTASREVAQQSHAAWKKVLEQSQQIRDAKHFFDDIDATPLEDVIEIVQG